MSETVTEAPVEEPNAVVEEPQSTPDPAPETPAEPSTPEPERKPRRTDRHVANLTARLATERAEREAAERRAEAAEALLQATKPEGERHTTVPAAAPVDRAAVRAEIEFDTRLKSVISAGQKEFPDWGERTEILHGLGATQNPAFMQALVELPNATKIVSALSEDPDALVDILNKSPTAMAAQLGRMDARMETAAKPTLSAAPRPLPKVETPTVVKEASIYDENLSMKEWAAAWDKRQKALGKRRY